MAGVVDRASESELPGRPCDASGSVGPADREEDPEESHLFSLGRGTVPLFVPVQSGERTEYPARSGGSRSGEPGNDGGAGDCDRAAVRGYCVKCGAASGCAPGGRQRQPHADLVVGGADSLAGGGRRAGGRRAAFLAAPAEETGGVSAVGRKLPMPVGSRTAGRIWKDRNSRLCGFRRRKNGFRLQCRICMR